MKYSKGEKHVTLRTFLREQFACVQVEDRGIGISEEDVQKIFDPFYRASRTQEHIPGTGIGLPLVRHIMHAHHGKIDVVSTLGKGSTFTLLFLHQ